MARKVFFSFHHQNDCHRVSQVRNMGVIEGNQVAQDNDWETIKLGGDRAISNWIDQQLEGRSCTVVLIGEETANRKWVKEEIIRSWSKGLGVVGIHIHGLKNLDGYQSRKGANPFNTLSFTESGTPLSTVVKTYSPESPDSRVNYAWIKENLPLAVEEAIRIRGQHN